MPSVCQPMMYSISLADWSKAAIFDFINLLQPSDFKSSILPGTANTSLLYPAAKCAVIMEPPLFPDSIMMAASAMPATILFRFGKFSRLGTVSLINSVSSEPFSIMSNATDLCSVGYILSNPCAKTPTVAILHLTACLCAITSIP